MVETRPDASRRWLESLPYGDMRQAMPKVLKALGSLNRTELSPHARAGLMPDYENSYHLAAHYYRRMGRMHTQNRISLDERLELHSLTREMAFAYKLIVNDTLAQRGSPKGKTLLMAIHAAIHYLGLMLMGCYENYTPAPVHLWRELYGLFAFAVQHELTDAEIESEAIRDGLPNIAAEFKRIALIALTDPYRLSRVEHWEIFQYLSYWVDLADVAQSEEHELDSYHFLVDLTGGGKPAAMTSHTVLPGGARWWINTKFLVARLHQHQQTLESSHEELNLGFSRRLPRHECLQILSCLRRAWEEPPERNHPRFPKINRVDVIWSVAAIHELFRALDPLSAGETAMPSSTQSFHLEDGSECGVSWEALNGSEGGLCLSQHSASVHQLEVGQLAAICEHMDGHPTSRWSLAVLRWLSNDHHRTTLGLEFLRGDVQVACIHALHGNKIELRPKPAFLISGYEVQGISTPTIIAPRGLHREGRMLCLQIGEEQIYLHARNRVEATTTFERFFYQTFEPSSEQLQSDHADRLEDDVMIDFSGHELGNKESDWDKF
ncbi:MAG: hypothetical protein HYV16_04235 [Gammaproteobacteria bacterium]|nr:hypothetical protein [Gammaproteobacteria bacterium]